MVAGRSTLGRDGLDALHQRDSFGLALHRVPAVKMQQIPLPKGDIEADARRLVQNNVRRAAIGQPHRAGQHVLPLEDAVQQLQPQTGSRILQRHRQGFGFAALIVRRRKPRECVFPFFRLPAGAAEIRAGRAVRPGRLNAGQAKIPDIEAGIFLWADIRRRHPAFPAGLVIIGGKASVRAGIQSGEGIPIHPAPVIQVYEMPQMADPHLIGGARRVQRNDFFLSVNKNAHGILPECGNAGLGVLQTQSAQTVIKEN